MTDLVHRQAPGDAGRLPVHSRLTGAGAKRWYGGALFALAYQAIELVAIWTGDAPAAAKAAATAVLALYYAVFLVLPPLLWQSSGRTTVLATLAFGVGSVLLFPVVGATTVWVWPLALVVAAFTWSSQWAAYGLVAAATGASAAVAQSHHSDDSLALAPWITASIGVLMVAFGQQVQLGTRLRAANERIADLAVEAERSRFARDMHDSIGHSLTVAAMQAELAGRLVERDPARAAETIGAVERSVREALADLRASVAGFRSTSLEGELAAVREALAAAGVDAAVTGDATTPRTELREPFAWALREAVTNVLRHSSATHCVVTLTRTALTVRNDGAAAADGVPGSGLRGIAERAAVAGATLTTSRDGGWFELRVAR